MYSLERRQILPISLDEAWDFISNPANLNRITPDDLDFEIITKLPEQMYSGLLINYKIKLPLLGKQDWLTEIKHVIDGESFVDEQRKGPYKFWYHYHKISEHPEGVEMYDQVTYDLPFSIFGKIAHGIYIKNKLAGIFNYRFEKLEKLFGKVKEQI